MTNRRGRDFVGTARSRVAELNAGELDLELKSGADLVLVDVREADEWREGHLPGAIHIPRGYLELMIDGLLPDKNATIVVYCAIGARSALAGSTMLDLGYTSVRNLERGIIAWREHGLDVVKPLSWTDSQRDRYSRHFVLPEVGEEGQARIQAGKVLVVGAGGLGSPALLYLAAAGVGAIGIVDFDSVEENNLQRQIIHATPRIGTNKAASAASTIEDLNPDVKVMTFEDRLTEDNVDGVVSQFDIVIDATDNFTTRYMLNDAAVRHEKPYVYGSIFRFEGYASVFWSKEGGPCYRCMHPDQPPDHLAPT